MAVDSAEEAPTQAPDVEDKVMEEVAAPSEEDENAMKIEEINLNKKEEQETFKEAQTQQEERGRISWCFLFSASQYYGYQKVKDILFFM